MNIFTKIKFEKSKFGIKAILKGKWKDEYLKILLNKNIAELELNTGHDWKGENIDFLEKLSHLKSFVLIDYSIKSVEPIYNLQNIEKLELLTYSKNAIDFNYFPNLKECGFEWIKGSESIFQCFKLEKLYINRYDNKNSQNFEKLINLKELTLLSPRFENISGITTLSNLKDIRISNSRSLKDFSSLNKLINLEKIEIQSCKSLKKLEEIFELTNLKQLFILDCGEIESIKGIENLQNLESFIFYESTNIIDGDLTPILKLSKLKKISYQNRKHYTHKREEFGKLYFG